MISYSYSKDTGSQILAFRYILKNISHNIKKGVIKVKLKRPF